MYEMVYDKPDLAYVVSVINRFIVDHGHTHYEALKWVLRYLNRMGVEIS